MSNTDTTWSGNVIHGIVAGLHPRGNLGHLGAAAPRKWWERHGDTHFSPSYAEHGIALRKQFFQHFLKGGDPGSTKRQPGELPMRHPAEKFVVRTVPSDSTDADVLLALRVFTPENEEVLLTGSHDPQVPVCTGRPHTSHHTLDPNRRPPYRPPHPPDRPSKTFGGTPDRHFANRAAPRVPHPIIPSIQSAIRVSLASRQERFDSGKQ